MTDSAIASKVCIALFVATSLLQAGLALTVAQVRSPLRAPRLVLGALIGNFVLVPAAAMLIARLFQLSDGLSLGLLLVAMSAGAPFLPRLVELARGDAALGVAVMTLLLVTTVAYLPLVLPWYAPGSRSSRGPSRSLFSCSCSRRWPRRWRSGPGGPCSPGGSGRRCTGSAGPPWFS